MGAKTSFPLVFALLCLFSSTCNAFNITKILSNYPDYGSFNDLLSQTGLAKEINSRQTITVLAVENGSLGAVSGRPLDLVKRILGSHVILDYYDQEKLSKLNKKSTILTTLYQTTGKAEDQQGFLNCTKTPDGIKFGSAAKGAPLVASLVGSVTSQPYNISVLHVSQVIMAPGIENSPPSPPSPEAPKKAPAPKKASAPEPSAEAPAPSEDDAPTKSPTEGPAPADAPEADAPEADAPEADSPDSSAPEADEAADAPSSGSSHSRVGSVAGLMGVVACMMAL